MNENEYDPENDASAGFTLAMETGSGAATKAVPEVDDGQAQLNAKNSGTIQEDTTQESISINATLTEQTPAYLNALEEQLEIGEDVWNYEKADELIKHIAPNNEVREEIRRNHPSLEAKLLVLEEQNEKARLKRQNTLLSELAMEEELSQAVQGIDLESRGADKVLVDDLKPVENEKIFIDLDEDGDEGDATGTIRTERGEHSIGSKALFVLLVLYDITQGGQSLRVAARAGQGPLLELIGINPDRAKRIIEKSRAQEKLLFSLSPIRLKDFFETKIKRGYRQEIVTFLAGISRETRVDLLSGREVLPRGLGRYSHLLDQAQIQQILSALKPEDIDRLDLNDVVAQRQTQAT